MAGESEEQRHARENRDLKLGEQVIFNPLIRDNILQHFHPYKLSDLQTLLSLRRFHGLLPDVDLKECYFEKAWGFRKSEFVLAHEWWEDSIRPDYSVDDMKTVGIRGTRSLSQRPDSLALSLSRSLARSLAHSLAHSLTRASHSFARWCGARIR